MASAMDLATKMNAFSISFVAKKTSVKALIYLKAPKCTTDILEPEEPEAVEEEVAVEEGGRALPSRAAEQHRARREANPTVAKSAAAKRTSGHQNGTNVQGAVSARQSTAAEGVKPKAARVDRNALSARSDGASKRPKRGPTLSPSQAPAAAHTGLQQDQDASMGESSSASLNGLGTQEDGNARALAWAARKPGAPDPNDPPVFGGASASLYGEYDDFIDDSDHG